MSQVQTGDWMLLGGGGHGRSVADVVQRAGGRIVVVVDPRPESGWSVPVEASITDALKRFRNCEARILVSIGDNMLRARIYGEAVAAGAGLGTLVAATATASMTPGFSAVLLEHSHVGPGAVIAEGVIVNTAALVEHDCQIDAFVHIAPGARVLDSARVGYGTLIGSGAVVLPGVVIGAHVVVGASAVVTSNMPDGSVVVGVPGRRVSR
jgi:sugar O-acyltransferase (sialic acid O-acetyltransferase NeuD family)